MPVEVEIIEDRIPELILKVEAVSRAGVVRVAERIAITARLFVAHDTWALNDTIHVESMERGKEAQVIAGNSEVDYAIYQEFGTYKMAAHPFMGPAADQHEHELPAEIEVAFHL